MKIHWIVTNLDATVQRVRDWQGQLHDIPPGKSILMKNPPKESYIFHIEPLTHEKEKLYFEELKGESAGKVLVTEAEHELEKKQTKGGKK